MDIYTRVELFSILGNQINSYVKGESNKGFGARLQQKIIEAEQNNPWFTKENIDFCLSCWAEVLKKDSLKEWISNYNSPLEKKKIGIIMAGNIPMVGFHDLLCVFFSGHDALVKISSKDNVLIPFLINELKELEPALNESIQFVEKLENHEAVIATGSNNTARYFEYYFKSMLSIIRKNRTSVAVITGLETKEELVELGHDVFLYFGLGCRNVTKLYLPKGYDLAKIFEAFQSYESVQFHHKYFNNYTYHKAIYLMNQDKFLDNGFFMIKEDQSLFSPISCLFYEEYDNINDLEKALEKEQDHIQVVVAKKSVFKTIQTVNFGQSQKPGLHDYADGEDVMKFLEEIR